MMFQAVVFGIRTIVCSGSMLRRLESQLFGRVVLCRADQGSLAYHIASPASWHSFWPVLVTCQAAKDRLAFPSRGNPFTCAW